MKAHAKAITALLVSIVATYLARAGFTLDPTQTDALTTLFAAAVTAFFTWAIPNTPKAPEQ